MTAGDADDRRRAKRESVLKSAKILYADTVIDCVVQNLSASGARVRLGCVVPVPERVELQFREGAPRPALRCWMRGTQIGFQFLATESMPGGPSPTLPVAA